MKYFPIRIAIICLLATPVLYIASLSYGEKYLSQRYDAKIQNILIGDSALLLDGSIRLEEQIAKNIKAFLDQDWLASRFNPDISVIVTAKGGKIIFPIFLDIDSLSKEVENQFESQKVAKENFSLLNSGLELQVDVSLSHGSAISLMMLAFYSSISFVIFFVFYRTGLTKAVVEGEENQKLITELINKKETQKKRLARLNEERQSLFENIESLNEKYQDYKVQAKVNEEELFDEIITLEEKLNAFIELKKSKEDEISELKSQIRKYERRKGSKTKRVDYDFINKRFAALYKNITMDRKALSGFLNLNDEQQIKAEEIIFLLDRSPDKVTVKRKVFAGKKHKTASFEVLFAYNGRLYFKRNDNNVEVLVIGTKNTQTKDMDYLHSI